VSSGAGTLSPTAWLLWCVAVFVGALELGGFLFWHVLGG
jgi:hypothetical protein